MKSIYLPVMHDGIYEVIRVDDNGTLVVVQTNIRTPEKAEQACDIWQARENQSGCGDLNCKDPNCEYGK